MDALLKALRSVLDPLLSQAQANQDSCKRMGDLLNEKARALTDSDIALANHLEGLAQVLYMDLIPARRDEPFDPMIVIDGKRSALPEDFNNEQLNLWATLLHPSVPWPPNAIARIADVLWLRKYGNRIQYAEMAVQSYLKYAQVAEDCGHWIPCREHLERAFRLAGPLRKGKPELLRTAVESMEKAIERDRKREASALSGYLMPILLEHDQVDANKYLTLAEERAIQAEKQGNCYDSEYYWKVYQKWAQKIQDADAVTKAQIRIAEGYATQAQTIADEGKSFLVAARWMTQAVTAYDDCPDQTERRDELYRLLRQYQKRALSELQRVEVPISADVSDALQQLRQQALAFVQDKPLDECLLALAFRVAEAPDYSQLQEQARGLIEKSFALQIAPTVVMDGQGRTMAQKPAWQYTSAEGQETVERQTTTMLAQMCHKIEVETVIEPVRKYIIKHVITKNNPMDEQYFLHYCTDSDFVVSGQELQYAEGLYYGLIGKFLISTNLLVPLIENSLRHILNDRGIETSKLNRFGSQEERPLSDLLDLPQTQGLFGLNQIQDLRALLVERSYANLRNRVAHGLMHTENYNQSATIYLWWTALRFILLEAAYRKFNLQADEMNTIR